MGRSIRRVGRPKSNKLPRRVLARERGIVPSAIKKSPRCKACNGEPAEGQALRYGYCATCWTP
ncbi:hypothetical protein [Micromonospora haikouensis]|uniref:hypothetical protein n=1 Tax=Micromonospora haikouensis TaxID=686309 RepID=UPI003D73F8A0